MVLLFCFAPLIVLFIGMVIGFICVQIGYARKRRRQRIIPVGKWSVSYLNLDYIKM